MAEGETLERLLRRRKAELGKSMREIGVQFGIKPAALSSMEGGIYIPTDQKLPAVAEAFSLSLEEVTSAVQVSKTLREKEKGLSKNASKTKKSEPKNTPGNLGNATLVCY